MGKWVDADDVNEKELMRKMKNLFDEALAKECNDWEEPITFGQFVESFDEHDKLTKRFFEVLLKEGRRRRLRNRAERQHQQLSAAASARSAANAEPSTLTTSQRIHGINHWFPHRRLARARMRREGALTGRDFMNSLTSADDVWPGTALSTAMQSSLDFTEESAPAPTHPEVRASAATASSATSAASTRSDHGSRRLRPSATPAVDPEAATDRATGARATAAMVSRFHDDDDDESRFHDNDDGEAAIADGLQLLAASLLQRVTGATTAIARLRPG